MIDRDHGLSVSRQAKALGISRGSVYYLPRPTSDADLKLMRRIDELHLEYPFAGSRMLQGLLKSGDRKKIHEYGGEQLIHTKIKAASRRGRQALRAASGLDAMLANPHMVPDEDGFPYTAEQAKDDEVQIVHGFRTKYTADAYRTMPPDTSIADKIAKKREVDEARHDLRQNLARQLRTTKAQSQ